MSVLSIIPLSPDQMSCYTAVAFVLLVSGLFFVFTMYHRWMVGELSSILTKIGNYDRYIDTTNNTIKEIQIGLAVQENSIEDIKSDITEIKVLISSINRLLLEMK